MSDFITLTCPSCGSRLQITQDLERFACAHCGNEHMVRRSGGVVSLAPVVEGLQRVQVGTDKTAAELAIARLTKEITDLNVQLRQVEREPAPTIGCLSIGFCLVGLYLLFIQGPATFIAGDYLNGILLIVIGIGTAALMIGIQFARGSRFWKDTRQKKERLTTEITRRQEALRKHRAVVDR